VGRSPQRADGHLMKESVKGNHAAPGRLTYLDTRFSITRGGHDEPSTLPVILVVKSQLTIE